MGRSGRSAPPSRSAPAPSRAPAPAPRQAQAPPPAPHHAAPAPAPSMQQSGGGGGMLAGLGATMAQGFAFGTGSALAREAVGAAMGAFSGGDKAPAPQAPQQTQAQPQMSSGPCAIDNQAFMQCLQNNSGNAGNCDFYYNALQSCQANNSH